MRQQTRVALFEGKKNSAEPNSEHFYLPQNGSERNYEFRVFFSAKWFGRNSELFPFRGTEGNFDLFRRNSVCSAERKKLGIPSKPFRRKKHSELIISF
jgi:hypothetical protein